MSNDFLSAFLSPQDLGQFQQSALQADPFAIAGSAIGQWQPNYNNMNAGQGAATAFGRAFMQGILSNYGQNRVADQVSKVVGVLPQMQQDPINMAVPEGINENAFNILKGNAILKKAQRDALLGDQNRVNVADMLKTVLGEGVKSGMITPIEALEAMKTGDLSKIGSSTVDPLQNPNSPGYKVNQDREDRLITLRKEFNALPTVQNFAKASQAVQALAGALRDNSKVSDQELVRYSILMIEPGMAVREGEQGAVASSQSIPEAWKNQLNSALSGKTELGSDVREGIKNLAARAYNSHKNLYQQANELYSKEATLQGLDPSRLSYIGEATKVEDIFKAPPLSKEQYFKMRQQNMSPEEIKSKYGM